MHGKILLRAVCAQRMKNVRMASAEAASTASTSERVAMPRLRGEDFRHPLDQQNTSLLQSLPGLNLIAKQTLGPLSEQVLYLENISTSVLVGPEQLNRLHLLMLEAAEILDLDPPDLYIRQDPRPNAYTLAIDGKKPFVVVHTSLVDLLTEAELQAVIAHELGHLKCDHGIWLTLANLLAVSAIQVPGFGSFVAANIQDSLLRWLRAAELTCDRAALLVAQDSKVVVSALMKLAGGGSSISGELNVDAFLEQARSYDKAKSSSPLGWYLSNAQSSQLSHPLPVLRAREVDKWAETAQCKALLRSGRKLQRKD
ncbi:plastoglobule-localized metallopeptidase [Cymbomonas tetramitiformis]|uniref:Plastoglobule-localized metallopeptidase n=1 Tax=Cymbomonas tetramitiformis TaxID=36881 RepID=A0AAE0F0I5_9CHLO|nr:plastoglobule-localized metallopeptidase [Cymbomonas tetramitiformis]